MEENGRKWKKMDFPTKYKRIKTESAIYTLEKVV